MESMSADKCRQEQDIQQVALGDIADMRTRTYTWDNLVPIIPEQSFFCGWRQVADSLETLKSSKCIGLQSGALVV